MWLVTNLFLTLPASHIYIYFQIACLNLDIFSEGRRGGGWTRAGSGEGGGKGGGRGAGGKGGEDPASTTIRGDIKQT